MGITEQDKIKNEYYEEAIRYMENAKETLLDELQTIIKKR